MVGLGWRSATVLLFGAVLLALGGCGGGAAATAPTVAPPMRPQLPNPALALPEGADWLLIAEPNEVMANPALRRIVDTLMPERRLTAWSQRYRVDPAKIHAVAIGGYPGGVLMIARGGVEPRRVVDATAEAIEVTETIATQPHPVSVGLIGSARVSVAAVDDQTVVVGEGAPEGWGVVFAYLGGDSTALTPALQRATFAAAADAQHPTVTLHLLAPLSLPMDSPLGLVFAGQQQLTATLTSPDPARLEVGIALSGAFPDTIEANLRTLIAALAQEPLGAALGLGTLGDSLRVDAAADSVTIRGSVSTDRVVLGLQALFGVQLWELFDARRDE